MESVCEADPPPKKKNIAGGGSEITVVCDSDKDKDPPAVMKPAGTHGNMGAVNQHKRAENIDLKE